LLSRFLAAQKAAAALQRVWKSKNFTDDLIGFLLDLYFAHGRLLFGLGGYKAKPGRLHDSDLLQFMSTPSAMHRSNIFLRQ
jgi:hypothetical protein